MSTVQHLTSPASHLQFTKNAESSGLPTVLYVSNSSLPACKVFTPEYEKLALRYNSNPKSDSDKITFAQMDFSAETSMLFKFAPNQLPVLTLMCRQCEEKGGGLWAKTVMGADLRELEEAIGEMMERAGSQKGS